MKNIQLFLTGGGVHPDLRARTRRHAQPARGPAFFPFPIDVRDLHRRVSGDTGILVIFVLGFGIPGLRLPNVTTDGFVWGLVALVIVWSAYVAEVYRAGIESIHPSQEAAARSLGLSRLQGTALRRSAAGHSPRFCHSSTTSSGSKRTRHWSGSSALIEVFKRSQIEAGGSFNFTPYVALRAHTSASYDPAGAFRRLVHRPRPGGGKSGQPRLR